METKFCKFCNHNHLLTSEFWFGVENSPQCKVYQKAWRAKKPKAKKDDDVEKTKLWRARNRERSREHLRRFYQTNRDKVIKQNGEYAKARAKTDVSYNLARVLRSRINKAIKGIGKQGSHVRDLGCSTEELKTYLESKFTEGMSWENYGYRGWHIDHVRPLASFNLEDPEQFKQAVHFTNLQPLWAGDNYKKGSKYIGFL